MIATNIFQPRNDWNVRAFNCRKNYSKGPFHISVSNIIKDVMGVNPLELKGFRGRGNATARQLYCDMMRKHSQATLMTIGSHIGKGHDTVLHSIKAVKNLYDTNKEFRITYHKIDMRVIELPNKENI